jgi:hypothetical protein
MARTVIPSIAIHRSQGGSPGVCLILSSSLAAHLAIHEPKGYPKNFPHIGQVIT